VTNYENNKNMKSLINDHNGEVITAIKRN